MSIENAELAPFLSTLVPIFTRNFGITRERWVVRVRRRLHRVSREILHKDRVLLLKVEICQSALPIVGLLFGINLWNSFKLEETVVMVMFEASKIESVISIEIALFLVAPDPISARNLNITGDRHTGSATFLSCFWSNFT